MGPGRRARGRRGAGGTRLKTRRRGNRGRERVEEDLAQSPGPCRAVGGPEGDGVSDWVWGEGVTEGSVRWTSFWDSSGTLLDSPGPTPLGRGEGKSSRGSCRKLSTEDPGTPPSNRKGHWRVYLGWGAGDGRRHRLSVFRVTGGPSSVRGGEWVRRLEGKSRT